MGDSNAQTRLSPIPGLRTEPGRHQRVTVNVAVFVPLYVAEIVTEVFEDGLTVLMVKVALVAPAATVTLDGTVATAGLLLDSVTTAPPEGAAALSLTVPVARLPPRRLVGFRVSELSVTLGTG
jgi:hypothetical protein